MIPITDDIVDRICDLLIEGLSMRRICLQEGMPSRATLLRWMASSPDFEAKCARARLMQADTMDDMVLDLIDEVDEDNAHAMKVKLSAIQWRASKLNPKKYGEKTQLTNGDGNGPVELTIRHIGKPDADH